MDICATFRLTTREYRSAQRNAPGMRVLYIGFALITVVCLVGLAVKGPEIELYVGLGLPLYLEVIVRRAASKSTALLAEPWLVRVTDETLTLRNAVRQAEVGWNAYSEAWERSGFWYLREISGASCFIPKLAFDGAQQAGLAEFFARRLPPRKVHWYSPRTWR